MDKSIKFKFFQKFLENKYHIATKNYLSFKLDFDYPCYTGNKIKEKLICAFI
jgi:hypothetical protein